MAVERWKIDAKPLAVGRGDAADIVIDDATLSRRHFLIFRKGTEYLVQDLQSQNGTWVDGQRAQLTKLRHHTCILAGRTLFMFSEHPAELVGTVSLTVGDKPALPTSLKR